MKNKLFNATLLFICHKWEICLDPSSPKILQKKFSLLISSLLQPNGTSMFERNQGGIDMMIFLKRNDFAC
jgi:hypothetical protein